MISAAIPAMIQAVKNFPNKILLCLAVFTSFSFFFLMQIGFLFRLIEEWMGVFVLPLLLLYLVSFVWAVGYFGWRYQKIGLIAILPLAINTIAFILLSVIPPEIIGVELNWIYHYHTRMQVVERINNHELSQEVIKSRKLPDQYKNASEDGKFSISLHESKLSVVFPVSTTSIIYPFGGMTDSECGFVYVSDNTAPPDWLVHSSSYKVHEYEDSWKMKDCWFWYSWSRTVDD